MISKKLFEYLCVTEPTQKKPLLFLRRLIFLVLAHELDPETYLIHTRIKAIIRPHIVSRQDQQVNSSRYKLQTHFDRYYLSATKQ